MIIVRAGVGVALKSIGVARVFAAGEGALVAYGYV